MKRFKVFIILMALGSGSFAFAQDDPNNNSARLLVHLLDYLAQDYGMAVSDGKILNQYEYDEQVEFIHAAMEASQKLSSQSSKDTSSQKISQKISQRISDDILNELETLQSLILSKDSPEKVSALCRKIQTEVIQETGLSIAPSKWPGLASGKKLFSQNCTQCHGPRGGGDGPLAKGLNPTPTNFLDPDHMKEVSPFKVFNTTRLGIPGTGMAPFARFSDKEIWDLAFYVVSLRYQERHEDLTASGTKPALSLDQVASSSDKELEPGLKDHDLASLRLYSEDGENLSSITIARTHLDQALLDYKANEYDSARKNALMAYLDGIEPIEPRLKANDAKAVQEIEMLMANVRSSIERRKSVEEVKQAIGQAHGLLNEIEKTLESKMSSPWFAFLASFGIILREGFEAILIIIALLGVVRASGSTLAARWIHGGWIVALGCGVMSWFFSGWLMGISGAGRELMEALTSLLAVVVLLYIGFWLHSKTEITRWTAFIESRVKLALQKSQLLTLGAISFMAVFREAFETVLFLRALWLEGGESIKTPLLAGTGSSFILIFVLAVVLLKFSVQIPIRKLFNLSAGVILALAVILTGKGFHAFQESGWVSITSFPLNLRSDFVGLYPTFETLLSQVVVCIICIFLWKMTHANAQMIKVSDQ